MPVLLDSVVRDNLDSTGDEEQLGILVSQFFCEPLPLVFSEHICTVLAESDIKEDEFDEFIVSEVVTSIDSSWLGSPDRVLRFLQKVKVGFPHPVFRRHVYIPIIETVITEGSRGEEKELFLRVE